jgi:hypothetical protein
MMRLLQCRGDWLPRQRIEGLRRYAFIGDSMVFGAGVAPDETLPFVAERQMNEMSPGQPVECVNLGVSGYNMLNSWLGFRQVPQIYDGVVITLCNNDAELFQRTYGVRYGPQRHDSWQEAHPCGPVVAACLDDIVAFTEASGLKVAIFYYRLWAAKSQSDIAALIAALCESRGLLFFDTWPYLEQRAYVTADLVVSAVDRHPSALAHEAVGRQVAGILKRAGWLTQSEPEGAPNRIIAAAHAMAEGDHYPPDAAWAWARRALDAQTRSARRIQVAAAGSPFTLAATAAGGVVASAARRWHVEQRLRCLTEHMGSNGHGIPGGLWQAQELALRLEELRFGLVSGNWEQLALGLDWPQRPLPAEPIDWEALAQAWRQRRTDHLQKSRAALEVLRTTGYADDSLAVLDTLVNRCDLEFANLAGSVAALGPVLAGVQPDLSPGSNARLLALLGAEVRHLTTALGFLEWLPEVFARAGEPAYCNFTTIDITVNCPAIDETSTCIMAARAEYAIPHRLPFNCAAYVPLDGTDTTARVYLPTFYAARILLSTFIAGTGAKGGDLVVRKAEVQSGPKFRRVLDGGAFQLDGKSGFVSPTIFLC